MICEFCGFEDALEDEECPECGAINSLLSIALINALDEDDDEEQLLEDEAEELDEDMDEEFDDEFF